DARLELAVSDEPIPEGVAVHVKVDTGMGRWGFGELPVLTREVVGLMSHLATASTDTRFAQVQIDRFRSIAGLYPALPAHLANSAAALRIPESRFEAARCGVALYGLSPFGSDPAEDGPQPVLGWSGALAWAQLLP